MNGLASASCARYVESFLVDKFLQSLFFLCRRLNFMNMFLFLLCRLSCLVFCSRSKVTCAHPPSFLYSPSYRRRLIAYHFLCYGPCSIYIIAPGYHFVPFYKGI